MPSDLGSNGLLQAIKGRRHGTSSVRANTTPCFRTPLRGSALDHSASSRVAHGTTCHDLNRGHDLDHDSVTCSGIGALFAFDHLDTSVFAEFDLPPKIRCPAPMTSNTRSSGNARSRTNAFELHPDGVDVSVHHVPNNPVAWLGVTFLVVGAGLVHISKGWDGTETLQPS